MPHVRGSVLNSGFHAVDSGFHLIYSSFCQWNLDSGLQSLVGFRTSLSSISYSKAHNFRQCFPDSESGNPYMEPNIIIGKFNSQLFPPTSCFKEFYWNDYLHFHVVFRRKCYIAFVTNTNLSYHYRYEGKTNSLTDVFYLFVSVARSK